MKAENISSGFSAVGGQTRSAYIMDSTKKNQGRGYSSSPSGSSTGSAVSVSAGYSPVSLGTETNGSIIGNSSDWPGRGCVHRGSGCCAFSAFEPPL